MFFTLITAELGNIHSRMALEDVHRKSLSGKKQSCEMVLASSLDDVHVEYVDIVWWTPVNSFASITVIKARLNTSDKRLVYVILPFRFTGLA